MPRTDPRVDAYIAKAAPFAQPILQHLRAIAHTGCPQLHETIKWGMPHFEQNGLLCGMAAFKKHCSFHFFRGTQVLGAERDAAQEAMGQFGRITSVADLPPAEELIGYVRKAAELRAAGEKLPRPTTKREPLAMPDDLGAALRNHTKAREAFDQFSPGQRREYIEWITEAKRAETREQRLATALEWIAEGKHRNWTSGKLPRSCAYGAIAKTRAGNPEPPFGFGKLTITIAPNSGSWSRFVSSSIW